MEPLWSDIVSAPWRAYPAAALVLIGVALLGRGLWFGSNGSPGLLRRARDPIAWIRGFQIAVAGLALVGIATAWVWRQPWLLIVTLGIIGEELLETSRILTALKRSPAPLVIGRNVGHRSPSVPHARKSQGAPRHSPSSHDRRLWPL